MKLAHIVALGVTLLLATACSKLTEANYAKLKTGMTYAEVTQVLGSADQCSETVGFKHCIWGDEKRNITVDFIADKALLFASSNIH